MISIVDWRQEFFDAKQLQDNLPRADLAISDVSPAVQDQINDIRARGWDAIAEYSAKYDGVAPRDAKVSAEQLSWGLEQTPAEVIEALKKASERIRTVHEGQLPQQATVEVAPGATVVHRWIPVHRVGLYVPGGQAVYPSSVLMNVIAAQVAGVQDIAVASPPQAEFDGRIHPTILAACAILGVDEVYAVGGASAIALFAYGADGCDPVDVITGPGNLYVATAKRLVQGTVGIDAEAGPTEIAIIADDTADARFLAADLISQAEHDELAAAVLFTPDMGLAEAVADEIRAQVATSRHRERIEISLGAKQSAIIVTRDLAHAIEASNAYAGEHLEIHTADNAAVAAQITNAGAIFLGPYTPVPLGDYAAGSNHVLPTYGTARFASGLGAHSFLKHVSQVEYSRAALAEIAQTVMTLAEAENLPAHGHAITLRTADQTQTTGQDD